MDNPVNNPVLDIQPESLDFSRIEPSQIQSLSTKVLVIKNSGGGVLTGKIIPQYKWVDIQPENFNLLGGESSQHTVNINSAPPYYWTNKAHHIGQALIVISNSGQSSVSVEYISPRISVSETRMPGSRTLFILAIVILMIVTGITTLLITGKQSKTGDLNREVLLTIGAETVYAEQTGTVSQVTPAQTITPISSEILVGGKTIPSTPENTPTPQMTFTPWPADQFPSPETVLHTYYSLLNGRNYEQAWSLLSENFKNNCCVEGLSQPFENYKTWWETIDRVEILSGYIIQPGANPLRIQMTLRYTLKSGGVLEDVNTFSLIADTKSMMLLIDEVTPTDE